MAPILLLLHSFLIFIHFNALILMLPPIHKDYLDHYKHNYNHIINYYNHQFGRHSCRSHNFNTTIHSIITEVIHYNRSYNINCHYIIAIKCYFGYYLPLYYII